MPGHYCKKKGHIAKVCHSKARAGQKAQMRTHQLQDTVMPGDEIQEYSLFHTKGHSPAPILVMLQINEIDP